MSFSRNLLVFGFIILVCVSTAFAEEKAARPPAPAELEISTLLKMEALFAVQSWLASEEPKISGAVEIMVSPLFIADQQSFAKSCAIACTYFTIGLYNLLLDENNKDKDSIFKENFIAWNVFLALYTLSDDSAALKMTEQEKGGFYLSTHKDSVALNYRFGF